MALVKSTLQSSIRGALQSAKDEAWSLDQVAAAWATAIHDYVREAQVEGVQSSVSVSVPLTGPSPAAGTGSGAQTGSVKIK